MNCTESCDLIFFRLGNNVENKRLLVFIFTFFIFSLEDALNVLSSFLSDCACVSHRVHRGRGGEKEEIKTKVNEVFLHHLLAHF